jgi:hypothetical protein
VQLFVVSWPRPGRENPTIASSLTFGVSARPPFASHDRLELIERVSSRPWSDPQLARSLGYPTKSEG